MGGKKDEEYSKLRCENGACKDSGRKEFCLEEMKEASVAGRQVKGRQVRSFSILQLTGNNFAFYSNEKSLKKFKQSSDKS